MRVWILTYVAPTSGAGGVERFVANLKTTLDEAGHDVNVLSATSARRPFEIRPIRAWLLGNRVNKLSTRNDLIICDGYFSWNANRDRSIIVYHGTELGRAIATSGTTNPFRNLAVRVLNSRLDRKAGHGRTIVAVSNATKAEIENLYGLRVDAVISNGIDLDTFKPVADKETLRTALGLPQDRFLVLYVGTPDPRKGYEFLVEDVLPRLPSSQRLIVTTEMKTTMEGVIAVGRVDFAHIVRYYQACDAFVMPSAYEGCSYALAEAMACGLPSVVSSTGSARDMLADSTLAKYVISKNNAEAYAERLRSLEESIEERKLASEASRRFAEEQFDIRDFRNRYADLVKSVAGGHEKERR